MSIQRGVLPSDNFVMISNQWVRDRRLGWKARGILTWLASHTVGFKISETSIVNAGPEGKAAVRAAVRELEELGYLVRTQQRVSHGKFGTVDYVLCDPWAPSTPTVDRFSAHGDEDEFPQVTTADRKSAHGSKSTSPQVSTVDRFPADRKPAHIRRPDKQKTSTTKKTKDQKPASPLAEGDVADRNARDADTTPSATSQDFSRMAGDVLKKLPSHYRDAPAWLRSRLLVRIEEALHAENSPAAITVYAAKFVGDPNFNQFEHFRQFGDVIKKLTQDVAEGITCPGCGRDPKHSFCTAEIDGDSR